MTESLLPHWKTESGIQFSHPVPILHPQSWVEAPIVIQATLPAHHLIQIGAFTGVYGGRLGHCRIGRYCSIAPGVDIASDQHPTEWLSSSMVQYVPDIHGWGTWLRQQGMDYAPPTQPFRSNAQVTIGHDVWIGQGVFIKSGVTIGNGAVIAAHSVVTHDIPAYAIAAGVPAKVIKWRFDETLIAQLQALSWWNYNVQGLRDMPFHDPCAAIERLHQAIADGSAQPLSSQRFGFTD